MSERNVVSGASGNFEFLIEELIEQQKKLQKTTNDLVSAVNSSTQKADNFENKLDQLVNEKLEGLEKLMEQNLDNLKNSNNQKSTESLKEILKKGFIELKLMLSAYPKGVTKKFQILLFPEQDAKLFYKIVFGKWFIWLVVTLFLSLTYKWIIHREDNNKALMMEAIKDDKITRAWEFLYSQKSEKLHRLMDSALKKTDSVSSENFNR